MNRLKVAGCCIECGADGREVGNFFSEVGRSQYQDQVNAVFRIRLRFFSLKLTQGGAMIPEEEVKPPDPEPSAEGEETQPTQDSLQEDPDTARGEAFKRMFPDVPRKTERPKKPSE